MEFQGFQHTLPGIVVALIGIFLIVIAWYSYKNRKSIPLLPRAGLIVLRSVTFLIILLLFLNPYFFSTQDVEKKPRFLFLIDDSESVTIQKGEYQGIDSYRSLISEIDPVNQNKAEIEYFTIGSSSRQIENPDSLQFNSSETNFSAAISQIQELEDDFDAVTLISDGIITYGSNPALQASNLTIPIYSIAIGDTSVVRDITVNNVVYNPTGYTDTRHLVEVEVAQNGFANSSTTVMIYDSEGNIITQKEITFNTNDEVITEIFEIPLTVAGLQQFSAEVQPIDGEWSEDNNRSAFSIDVSESKIKMFHISFEIHPDVKMVRSVLSGDQNVELTTLTWLGGNNFVEDQLPEIDDMDLLLIQGVPPNSFNNTILGEYQSKPSVYIQLPGSRSNTSTLSELQLIENNGIQLFQISLIPDTDGENHPILELPEVGFQNLAPLTSSLRTNSLVVDGVVLFNSVFQGIENTNPVIQVLERGGIRRVQISAWDWYKMYQSPNETEREFVTALFSNIAIWASNDPDDRRLKISPSKSAFTISEEIIINANLNNESGAPETEATIEVTLSSADQDQRSFNMQNDGNGTYKLTIPSLTSGLYSYSATARKGDREIDTQSGEFLIENSNAEFVNTVRNDQLLSSLAYETGGEFFTWNEDTDLWSNFERNGLLQTRTETIESYIFPVRNIFWFILVILLLGSEWIIRKFYSLP